jgi:hypothetical protein
MLAPTLALLSLAATAVAFPFAGPAAPTLTYLYTANLTLPAPISIGAGPLGTRQVFGISGGSFSGPKLTGAYSTPIIQPPSPPKPPSQTSWNVLH